MGMDMPSLRPSVTTTQNESSGSQFVKRRRGVSSAWTAMQLVIKSAALYSVAGLIYIPFVASFVDVPQNTIFFGYFYAEIAFTIAAVSLVYIFSRMNALFVLTQQFHGHFQVVAPALIMLRTLLVRNGNGRQQYTEWSGGVKSIIQFNPRLMDTETTVDSDLEAETVQVGSRQIDANLGSNSNPCSTSSPSQLQQEEGMVMETLSWAWYRDRYALTWLENREPA
jgi:hypothetical protein